MSAYYESPDGKKHAILKLSIGETIDITYLTEDGEKESITVTLDTDGKVKDISKIAPNNLPVQPKTEKLNIPGAPDPFKGGEVANIANCKVTHIFGQAIAAGGTNTAQKVGGWKENSISKHPIYRQEDSKSSMSVYLEPSGYNAAELWEKVHNLDALVLDVYLVALALVCDPRNNATHPTYGWFTINPAQVLEMKAFKRYGNDRRVLTEKIIEALHTLSDLRTNFNIPWPGHGKGEQKRMARETGCRLFHIGSVTYEEDGKLFEHPGEFPEGKRAVAVSLILGKWGGYWVRNGETYYWVAGAARVLLELEHRSDRKGDIFAKKIGMLLLTFEGGTDSRNKTLCMTIAELLEEIRELPEEGYRGEWAEENRKGEHWAARTDEYLQDGLGTLRQAGLLASYNFDRTYPDPSDRGAGWSERWLNAKVFMTTPEAAKLIEAVPVQTAPKVMERKRRERGTGKVKKQATQGQFLDKETVAAIYAAYTGRNWKQETLARELKISRPTLSNVLNGRKAPSIELAARIKAFLDSPAEK